jgi:hypothetical protein
VLPGAESCLNMGADDDCDGARDDIERLGEDCTDESQHGICKFGKWQCQNNVEQPACVTAAPQTEICDDINQDCDPNDDTYGDLNTDANCGRCGNKCEGDTHCCHLQCLGPDDFVSDDQNCGGCGIVCGEGTSCCWNDCVPWLNSGGGLGGGDKCACRQDCGNQTCCGDSCADLMNDAHNCGACGNDCTRGIIAAQCCNGQCAPICAIDR